MNSLDFYLFTTCGLGVIASYIWGARYLSHNPDPSIWAGLWPANVYIVTGFALSATVSAAGFVWVAINIIFNWPDSPAVDVWTCLFLIASASYLPLAIAHYQQSVFFCLFVVAVSATMLAAEAVTQMGAAQSTPVLWLAFHCTFVDLGYWFGTWQPGVKSQPIPESCAHLLSQSPAEWRNGRDTAPEANDCGWQETGPWHGPGGDP